MSYIFTPLFIHKTLKKFVVNRRLITKIAANCNRKYHVKWLLFFWIFQTDLKMGEPQVINWSLRMGNCIKYWTEMVSRFKFFGEKRECHWAKANNGLPCWGFRKLWNFVPKSLWIVNETQIYNGLFLKQYFFSENKNLKYFKSVSKILIY